VHPWCKIFSYAGVEAAGFVNYYPEIYCRIIHPAFMKKPLNYSVIWSLLLIVVFAMMVAFTQPGRKNAGNDQSRKCLIVSDIHFSPLFGSSEKDTVLKRKLEHWSFDEWKKYFESTPAEMKLDSTLLFQDANYAVLESAIANMKRKLPHPAFIVIAGDFIWHGAIPADSLIKKKALLFIARLFKENFPGALIVPAMGNNDTYGNDYDMQDAKFLRDFANAWEPDLPTPSADSLKKNGYYTCEDGNLKFVVVNSALLYANSKNPLRAQAMLKWLKNNLAGANGKNIWLLTHIPPGLNSFNGQDFWKKEYVREFVNTLVSYAPDVRVMICSHTHFDDFKVVYDASAKPVALVRLVPSICSNHGNYPSFEIATVSTSTDRIIDETSWYLNLARTAKGISPGLVRWKDSVDLKTCLGLKSDNPVAFSQFLDRLKTDTSLHTINQYATFYDVGTPISSLTINKKTYLKYLKADSLQEK
jgi:sphingomyelin phosphodiesterase acid-like 3